MTRAEKSCRFMTMEQQRITFDPDVLAGESEAMYARAGEPKKLVMLKGFGRYEVYGGDAFARSWTRRWRGTGRIFRRGDGRSECLPGALLPEADPPL
jgi:hypothetical protein